MKTIHIVDRLGVGGAETWLMALLRYWRAQGDAAPRMDFLATSGEPGVFDDEARRLGAKVFYLTFRRGQLASFARRWRRVLAENNYDVIHDHQEFISGWHFLLAAGLLPPVRIAHVHNPLLGYRANYAVTVSRRLTAALGRRLVAAYASHVCGTSAAILRANGYEPGGTGKPLAVVAHCGFDVGRFDGPREDDRNSVLREFGWPADTKLVLSVGRIDRALAFDDPQNHKNTWFAIDVVKRAAESGAAVRYLLAGDGGGRQAMQDQVAAWGLRDRIRFAGLRHDIPRLMRAADVLLFPSAGEGLGMAAVEAQAAGLPVLASDVIPNECVVLPRLYTAMSLQEPLERWVDGLLKVAGQPKPTPEICRAAVENSSFSIANSARTLINIYRSGAR